MLTKVGVLGRDKRLSSTVDQPLTFNMRDELDALFHGNDLARRITSLPAREMVRRWIQVKQDGPTVADVAELQKTTMEAMQSLNAIKSFQELIRTGRLYGSACLFMGVDDGRDVSLPLDLAKAKSLKFMTLFDRYELQVVQWYTDPFEENYNEPELYQIQAEVDEASDQKIIHESRILRYDGTETGRWRKKQVNDGWADSVFVGLFSILRDYDGTWDSTAVLMRDFAQAVIKMNGLADAMASGGEDVVMARMELMDTSRSVLRAILLDADNEDFQRKPTPLMGLPELLIQWLYRMSAAAEIPITLLFGMSPGGLNATGESDVRFFYDHISSKQETELRPLLERFLTVLYNVNEGPTKGVEPESWSFVFRPLWQLSDTEEATRRKSIADADVAYINAGVLNQVEVATSRFGGDTYSAETALQLDETERLELAPENNEPEPDLESEPAPEE